MRAENKPQQSNAAPGQQRAELAAKNASDDGGTHRQREEHQNQQASPVGFCPARLSARGLGQGFAGNACG